MSGGSFNYAYLHVDDSDVLAHISDYREAEQWLRAYQKHDAADEVLAFILDCETAQRRLCVRGKRVADLLWAAEWTASGDTNMGAVDLAMNKLVGIPDETPTH